MPRPTSGSMLVPNLISKIRKIVREGPIEIMIHVKTRTVLFLSLFCKSLFALNPAIIAPGTDKANMSVNSSGNQSQK